MIGDCRIHSASGFNRSLRDRRRRLIESEHRASRQSPARLAIGSRRYTGHGIANAADNQFVRIIGNFQGFLLSRRIGLFGFSPVPLTDSPTSPPAPQALNAFARREAMAPSTTRIIVIAVEIALLKAGPWVTSRGRGSPVSRCTEPGLTHLDETKSNVSADDPQADGFVGGDHNDLGEGTKAAMMSAQMPVVATSPAMMLTKWRRTPKI